jgi:hypothetical protein
MKKPTSTVIAVVLAGLLNACTWVKTTPEGEPVSVATADAVTDCARNEGALLGGDTVVAETPVSDGSQVFGVYQCKGG